MPDRIIGLTGQSGSGKSTVSKVFAAHGFDVCDADMVSREVTARGSAALDEIAAEFGSDMLTPDGSLDRRKLGAYVFSDRAALDRLEGILYPYILRRIGEYTEAARGSVLLDAPTLFEAGADRLCDMIISVVADEDIRLRRIMARDGIDETAARNRFSSQHDEAFFRERSDIVIENNGGEDELISRVTEIIENITGDN